MSDTSIKPDTVFYFNLIGINKNVIVVVVIRAEIRELLEGVPLPHVDLRNLK